MKKKLLLLVLITTISFNIYGCSNKSYNSEPNEVKNIFEHSFSSDLFQFSLILKQLSNVKDMDDYTYAEGMMDLFLARQIDYIKSRVKRTAYYDDVVYPSLQNELDELQQLMPEYLKSVKDSADQNLEYILNEKQKFKDIRDLEREINGERIDTIESSQDIEPKIEELIQLLKEE